MEIKISGKECERILKDYAFNTFGKILSIEKQEDLSVEIDVSYSTIKEMNISKIKPENNPESEA